MAMKLYFKRIISCIMVVLLSCAAPVWAAGSAGGGQADGTGKLVPVRFISEEMGAQVSWDEGSQMAGIVKGDTEIKLTIGSSEALVNGKAVKLPQEVKLVNYRTMAPLEFLKDAFGSSVTWDDCVKAVGKSYAGLLMKGMYNDAATLQDKNLGSVLPANVLGILWNQLAAPYGELQPMSSSVERDGVHEKAVLNYQSTYGIISIIVKLGADGLVDDFNVTPLAVESQYKAPSYDKPSSYTERDVVIGSGKWALPGTLTMPSGSGPFAAVVLVHGSGPNDRDEELGPLKLFKDLAAGLASNGIAVLRYDKRTYVHTIKASMETEFTLADETVDDAVAAVELLSGTEGIDPSRIFVLGHSQGGMAVPRIIEADKDSIIKGAVIMSGNTRPIEDMMVDQYKYLSSLGNATKQQVDFMEAQAAMLKDPGFNPANPPQGFALGTPYWWYDMNNYHPGELAKGQKTPMLVIQGERDYQVKAEYDFQGWKDALSGRSDVVFKLYPKLNHMYTEGTGELSTPMEYFTPANIPQYVIDDITGWINSVK